MENQGDLLKRIVADPGILVGKPIIRGLRISVEQILHQLAAGISKEQILREFPELEPEDILACLEYAAQSVKSEKLFKYTSVKFIVDANVSYLVDLTLKSKSIHDYIFIRDLNPSMKDMEIIELAEREERIIITGDKDFGELVFKNQLKHQGVLLLRIDELELHEKLRIVVHILDEYGEFLKGKFAVYQKGKLRIR